MLVFLVLTAKCLVGQLRQFKETINEFDRKIRSFSNLILIISSSKLFQEQGKTGAASSIFFRLPPISLDRRHRSTEVFWYRSSSRAQRQIALGSSPTFPAHLHLPSFS
jgi:hypothetical protein